MPLLAAAIGVLGGVGGAYIGGVVANQGQEQQSESERAAAIQDLRIEVYGSYLATAQQLVGKAQINRPAEVDKLFPSLLASEARVVLITDSDEIEEAAAKVEEAVIADPRKTDQEMREGYATAANNFLAVARDEIEKTGD
jgi:hypothetical protein